MSAFASPAVYAALVWWFTTGVILYLDGRHPATFRWSLGTASLLAIAALRLIHTVSGDTTANGAYIAFTSAILVWGWIEMSFLMGFVTGIRRHACRERCGGWRHFVHATEAIIYNELATVVGGACVLLTTGGGPNRVAVWTYGTLWVLRLSAKLNLFLGVPNLGEKFLPPHLQYLRSFFRKRAMNFLFPLSVSGATIGVVILAQRFATATNSFGTTAYALLTTLLSLALLEHWFMVLPLPSERLWKWALRPLETAITAKAP